MRQFFVLDLYVLRHIASKQAPSTSSAGHSTIRPCGDDAVPHTDSSAWQKLKHLIQTLKLFVWPLQTVLLYSNTVPRSIWPSQCRAAASVRKVISNAKSRRSDTRLHWHGLRGGEDGGESTNININVLVLFLFFDALYSELLLRVSLLPFLLSNHIMQLPNKNKQTAFF